MASEFGLSVDKEAGRTTPVEGTSSGTTDKVLKDLTIAFEEAAAMELDLKALAMARAFYELAVNEGLGRKGTQALQLLIERDPVTSS